MCIVYNYTIIQLHLVPAPGQVSVVVSSITATSISLSWSVVGGSVAWSEVVWRETAGRGTESSSGNLTDTSYTINNLMSSTNYSAIVRVTNIAGTTESSQIIVSTGIYIHKKGRQNFELSIFFTENESMGITRIDVVSILGAVLCGVILLFIAVVIVIGILLWKEHRE